MNLIIFRSFSFCLAVMNSLAAFLKGTPYAEDHVIAYVDERPDPIGGAGDRKGGVIEKMSGASSVAGYYHSTGFRIPYTRCQKDKTYPNKRSTDLRNACLVIIIHADHRGTDRRALFHDSVCCLLSYPASFRMVDSFGAGVIEYRRGGWRTPPDASIFRKEREA